MRAGPLTPRQRGAIMAHFGRLGLAHPVWRESRLAVAAALVGVDRLGSVNDLASSDAARLIGTLGHFRDARDLAAHLAWTAIQNKTYGDRYRPRSAP